MRHELTVTVPSVPFGPEGVAPRDADAQYYRSAARNIRHQKQRGSGFAGSNLTETVALLCESVAASLEQHPDDTQHALRDAVRKGVADGLTAGPSPDDFSSEGGYDTGPLIDAIVAQLHEQFPALAATR